MRRPMIAGNWKMNKTPAETVALLNELKKIQVRTRAEVVVCPMTVSLFAAGPQLKGTDIKLGAQNVHFEDKGAFTGEANVASLKELGVEYVILGHSERRQYFGETDETVNQKVLKCLENGLKPIVCVGESLSEKQRGITNEVVCLQTKAALCGVTKAKLSDVVIAYEPIWAIGTGMTATAQDANATIGAIRSALRDVFGYMADDVRILYGGSMNDKNANELMSQPEIDGGLIGGASLVPEKFEKVINYHG
ncbi:MAG: triose-phosphate isomerase [Oscillospiraceae bacterium]|nr:triose-phosphate isomerase [Oscillospiraceae bacterium]